MFNVATDGAGRLRLHLVLGDSLPLQHPRYLNSSHASLPVSLLFFLFVNYRNELKSLMFCVFYSGFAIFYTRFN